MANQEQIDLLKRSVKEWNEWRRENHEVDIDLCLANLRGVNLNFANLRGVNLKGANLRSADLIFADLDKADLSSANLSSASLNSVNLRHADLRSADLTYAHLNDADFSSADLNSASLINVHAQGTNFYKAILTGACIQGWNINSRTNLQDVTCQYIFNECVYDIDTLTGKLTSDFTDRIPHDPTKFFAPSDFTKLVQESLNTVNLIFRDGLDWRSFAYSFQQLQVEYADEQIAIRSIENKGDGTVIVKLATAPGADKGGLEQSFFRGYELGRQALAEQYRLVLEEKDKQINYLIGFVQDSQKLMAENSKSNIYNNYYNQGDWMIGNFANTMQDQASMQTTQYIGAKLDEIAPLIHSLRGITKSFPSEQRQEAIDHLDDLEADLKQPPEKRKLSRAKAAILALMATATAVSGAVTRANEFVSQTQELAEKLGIPLPIEQVQTQSSKTVNVKAEE